MAFLKHATAIALLAGTGVMGMAGVASAAADSAWNGGAEHHDAGDNAVGQGGVIPVNALNDVNVAPNFGCLLDQTVPDLTAQSLVGLIPVGVSLNHLLQHPNLNVLANGNTNVDTYDYSCTSNQGSSQAGNDSHGSVGAGDSFSNHSTADGAGSQNAGNGAGAGGLLGATGVLGKGGLDLY
ncbi:hypothetical protein GCM10009839_42070 [Catenulispora yoronensis]|uniref:Uncharacterized protein n=1 Tax=Catenulispora yoronensis TaxID=450799 RepID=A0ABN2UIT3_9ACTN